MIRCTRVIFVLAIVISGVFSGCVTFQAGAPRGVVYVIAHRGASHDAPENTLAAFELAHEMGADWFELDCYLTRDDAVIVLHDDTLDRTTDGEGPVTTWDLEALRALDAGSWKDARFAGEPLPTLYEVLDLAQACMWRSRTWRTTGPLMAHLLD